MDKHWNWRLNWKYRIGQSRLPNTVHRKNWTKSKAITSPSHGKKSWKSTSAHVWRSEFRKMFSLLPHSHLILTLLVCVCVCIVCTLLVFQFNSIQSSKLRITKNSNSNWRRYNTDVGVTLYYITLLLSRSTLSFSRNSFSLFLIPPAMELTRLRLTNYF